MTDFLFKTLTNNKTVQAIALVDENGDFINGMSFISGQVSVFDDLPNASEHNNEFWLVLENSDGFLSFLNYYKYPKGLYTSNGTEWNIAPLNIRFSEDTLTIVNITDWSAFYNFITGISQGDRIVYLDVEYKNLTGNLTSLNPVIDVVNWQAVSGGTGSNNYAFFIS